MEGRLWPNCNHFNEIFYDVFVHVHLSSMAAICHHSAVNACLRLSQLWRVNLNGIKGILSTTIVIFAYPKLLSQMICLSYH